jgi:predicted dienelactone hydrolase
MMMKAPLLSFGLFCLAGSCLAEPRPRPTEAGPPPAQVVDLEWQDSARNRRIPVRIYLPDPKTKPGPQPVIVFSHGLGGSREGYAYLGHHWSAAGYVSVHLQHEGSDDAVWRDSRPEERMTALKKASANPLAALARPLDVTFAIDELERLNKDSSSPLHGRLDLKQMGMAGHSFGGFTTMAIAGQKFREGGRSFADPRIKAAIQMSAPVPRGGKTPAGALAGVRIPVFHMTGTLDDSVVAETKAEDRRILHDRMNQAESCLLIIKDGDHMIFSGRGNLDATRAADDERFQKQICKSSTAFWDAHLKGSSEARTWLYEGGFVKELAGQGTFEIKRPAP